VTGPDIIQLPKTGEKEVATGEGADLVQASSPEFNPKPTQSSMNDAGTNAAITGKEANKRAPDEKAESVKAAPPELNPKLTKPGENDATTEALAAEAKATASDQNERWQRFLFHSDGHGDKRQPWRYATRIKSEADKAR
jgi:hypothetical protein